MRHTGKSLTVKEWFANKVANEVKSNINMCDIFAIIKETEKAVYAMVNLGTNFERTMWVPKSVLIENEIREEFGKAAHHETIRVESYEEAAEEFRTFWAQYC